MKRIGIDARFYNESGVGRYLRNLVSNLKSLDKKNDYFIFLLKNGFEQFEETKNFKKVLADFPWYGFTEQFKFPKVLKKYNLDLVHFPHFNVPIFYNGKFVVTIHDLIHQHFQMRRSTTHDPLTYKIKQIGYNQVFKKTIQKSCQILTPSHYVKSLLEKGWRVKGDKITVTGEAVDDKIFTIVNKMKVADSKKILQKLNVKLSYIFYVGNAHPHKNVEGLIRMFRRLKEKYQHLQLVLAGHDHYFWQRIKREYQDENIIYIGRVSDEQLVALYKNAQAFVMPSFEEGFGIPILEAMAVGCPVVSSNAGSLKEVGGDAALYFDPGDQRDMGNKIDQVLESEKLGKELIAKGKIRVEQFSWEELARKTLEVYNQCG